MLETSDKKAGVCARSLTHTDAHAHEWLEGKSSCRLSMTSNKRTIENNKTGSHSGASGKEGRGKKVSPLLLQATSQRRVTQTADPLSGDQLLLNGFAALQGNHYYWMPLLEMERKKGTHSQCGV